MKLFSVSILLLVFVACSSPCHEDGFIIKGRIKGLSDQYLYFDRDFHSDVITVKDSFLVKNERFTLKGKVSEPAELDFYSKDFKTFNGHLIVENTKIRYRSGIADNASEVVEGSFSNQLFQQYLTTFDHCYKANDCKLNKQTQAHLLQHSLKLVKAYPQHPVSLMGTRHLLKYLNTGQGSADILQQIVDLLRPAFEGEPELKQLQYFANATALRQEGSYFIQYKAHLPDGQSARLSDFYGHGYLFVNCWASWCGPCREEYRYFDKVYEKFKESGFQLVSISYDSKMSSWQKAIRQDGMEDHINMSELKSYQNTISQAYGINQVPDNFLLDKNGKIIGNNIPAKDLMELMEELIGSGK
ncbi:redoxin domain-containing protein [Carboxylicivirga sp. RSCT41]|uniref:redoxin domain-containing protein n=1 Tax=Carboxylicivirga agarovorans TaxID=3417570 RepID=UPI003D32F643